MPGSIHRHQSTWRSLIFNRHYIDNGTANPDDQANLNTTYVDADYYLDQCDPSRLSVQDYRELRQFLEGAEPNEAFEGVRAFNAIGRIVAPDYGTLEDMAMALDEAFSVASVRIAAQATDPVGLLPFSFKLDTTPTSGVDKIPATRALRAYCRPGPGRPVQIGRVRGGLIRPYSWQLIAFDPFLYADTLTQTSLTTAGGNVTNGGNIYTRPKIRIAFSGVGNAALTVTNSTTGKAIVIDATTAAASEAWILDVALSKLYRESDGANRYSQRVSGFITDQWLQPGVNAITFANTTGVSGVRFDFRGAYA